MVDKEDECFLIKSDIYTISKANDVMLLKQISIKKKPLSYSFIGGMWYSNDRFSLENDISLPYPFTTYYTTKIIDETFDGKLCRSLIYVKMPLLILQFEDECICIEFDPFIKLNDKEIFPFISLVENDDNYIISFYLFNNYCIKEKKSAWLGFGKKREINPDLQAGNTFRFSIKTTKYEDWTDAVKSFISHKLPEPSKLQNVENTFKKGKQALWRSYDALTGSFLQLPWKHQPGFTFQNSSHSLLSYEAVRLDYFSQWNQTQNDKDIIEWTEKLKKHFTNPHLSRIPSKQGDGLIWYNMTYLNKEGLRGFFYMDCGYAGYPGGQATISYHLLNYIKRNPDDALKKRIQQTLNYIISTQKNDGSWPMAIRHEGIIRFRPEKLEEYTTFGGSGEAVRALFLAAEIYKNPDYQKAAEQGLSFLNNSYPICLHGLRDIGINEPEAFSAVSIIHAFLDGYDHTKKDEYLQQAFNYAWYLASWMYTFDTKQWKFAYTIHPISYSITPRVSPYETVWVVSLFLRLKKYSKDKIWNDLAKICYQSVLPFISHTGGMSEGVFPMYNSTLESIPMEQTFATVELMNASYQFMDKKRKKEKGKTKQFNNELFNMKKDKHFLHIHYDDELVCSFDSSRGQITFLKNVKLGEHGISLSLNGPYTFYNKLKQKIMMRLRGSIGKYVLGVKDVKYVFTGVKAPKIRKTKYFDFFFNHIKSHSIHCISNTTATINMKSKYHKITFTIHVNSLKDKIILSIDPIEISVLDHGLACTGIYVPLIDAPLTIVDEHTIHLKDCVITGDFSSVESKNGLVGIDRTLQCNWTHGGSFSTKIDIIF